MIIKILQDQLEASNATNVQLNLTISRMSEEMKEMRASFELSNAELRKTIANLEALLKERDIAIDKVSGQLRGARALAFRPSEKQKPEASPKTDEQIKAEQEQKAAERKARGNNGAKRKQHFELETREEDVYPDDVDKDLCIEIGVRDAIRYTMIPPRFIKTIYHLHTLKKDEAIYAGKAPLAPLQNSSFDGSFIAGMAELRYLQSMPVERIVKYFQAHGFNLDKQTAHGLLAKTAVLFELCGMTMNTTILRIGNSSGIIIPSAIMKSLSLSVRDKISICEENGKITLRKLLDNKAETPFSALDVWCDENGYGGEDSLGEALEYVEGIRADRNNKEIPQW